MKPINLNKTKSFQNELDESKKDEITIYFDLNEKKKNYEKDLKDLKPKILKMVEDGRGNNGIYEAIKTVREIKSLDEEKLLDTIKEFLSNLKENIRKNEIMGNPFIDKLEQYKALKDLKIIKTKEYVDDEALEKAIYNNLVDPKLLEPAQSIKESVVLTVRAVK
ncbi:MAG: hypothetical protein ACOC22_02120 [bacterium]